MHLPADRIPASPRAEETSPRYAGWRVVIVCFVMAVFSWGFGFYGHAVYLAELQRLHGWPASLISGASTLYYLASAILVAFVSDAIAWLGPRRLVLAGTACMAAATALIAVIAAPWQVYAAYLVMSFGWAGMSLGAVTNILGLWFEHRRGLAISLALNGASFGGIVLVPALVGMIGLVGFAEAMLDATAAMLAVLVPMTLAWIDRPAAAARAADPADLRDVPTRWTRSSALRSWRFWTASGPFALALLAQVGFIVHQIAFLEPALGRGAAGLAVAVTAVMAVVGRVGLGTIIDRLDPRTATAVSLLTQAAALGVMTQATGAGALFAACAVFGLSVGNLITFPALVIQREFDAASFGMLMALASATCQTIFAFGPGLLGLVRDLTGGYAAALALCIALELVAAAVALLGRPKPAA